MLQTIVTFTLYKMQTCIDCKIPTVLQNGLYYRECQGLAVDFSPILI